MNSSPKNYLPKIVFVSTSGNKTLPTYVAAGPNLEARFLKGLAAELTEAGVKVTATKTEIKFDSKAPTEEAVVKALRKAGWKKTLMSAKTSRVLATAGREWPVLVRGGHLTLQGTMALTAKDCREIIGAPVSPGKISNVYVDFKIDKSVKGDALREAVEAELKKLGFKGGRKGLAVVLGIVKNSANIGFEQRSA